MKVFHRHPGARRSSGLARQGSTKSMPDTAPAETVMRWNRGFDEFATVDAEHPRVLACLDRTASAGMPDVRLYTFAEAVALGPANA